MSLLQPPWRGSTLLEVCSFSFHSTTCGVQTRCPCPASRRRHQDSQRSAPCGLPPCPTRSHESPPLPVRSSSRLTTRLTQPAFLEAPAQGALGVRRQRAGWEQGRQHGCDTGHTASVGGARPQTLPVHASGVRSGSRESHSTDRNEGHKLRVRRSPAEVGPRSSGPGHRSSGPRPVSPCCAEAEDKPTTQKPDPRTEPGVDPALLLRGRVTWANEVPCVTLLRSSGEWRGGWDTRP